MSLVMTFATNDYVVMSGDYRMVYTPDDSIYFDDSPKVFIANDKVLIGFTGDVDVKAFLRGSLNFGSNETVQSVARKIKKGLKAMKKEVYFTAHVAGISDTGRNEILKLSHIDNFKPERTIIPKDSIKWMFSYANEDPEDLVQKEFIALSDYSSESLINLAAKVNKAVGETDNYVSRECTVLCSQNGGVKMFQGVPEAIDADNV